MQYLRKGVHPRFKEIAVVTGFVDYFRKGNDLDNQQYEWQSEQTDCSKCNSLNGQIFDYLPNVEDVAHPNCKCKVVPIDQAKAKEIIKIHEENLLKRDDVVNYLNKNAKDQPPKKGEGECAKYVRNALKEGGIDLRKHQDVNNDKDFYKAYRYGEYLKKENFNNIQEGQGDLPKSYEMQTGDVVIFNKLNENESGHMQMFDGEKWISDYKQNTGGGIERGGNGFFPSNDYKENGKYTIYRKLDWQKWESDLN